MKRIVLPVFIIILLFLISGCDSDIVLPYSAENNGELIDSALNSYYRRAIAVVVPETEYIENDEKYLKLGYGVLYHDEKNQRTSLYLNYIYRYKGQDDGTVTVFDDNNNGDIILSAGGGNFRTDMKYSLGNAVDDTERGLYRDTLTLVYSDNSSARLPYENETEYELICPGMESVKLKLYPADKQSDEVNFYASYGITVILSSEQEDENTVSVSLTVFEEGNHKPVGALNALDDETFRNVKLKSGNETADYLSFSEHDVFTNVTTFYFPRGNESDYELLIKGFYAPREIYGGVSMKDLSDEEIENLYTNEGPALLLPVPSEKNETVILNAEIKFPYGCLTVDSAQWVSVKGKDYIKLNVSKYGNAVKCPYAERTDETEWILAGFSVIKSFSIADNPVYETDGNGFMKSVYLPFNPGSLSNERFFSNGIWRQKHETTYGLYYIIKNITIPFSMQP